MVKEVYEKTLTEDDDDYNPLEHAKRLIDDDDDNLTKEGSSKTLYQENSGPEPSSSSQVLPERQREEEDIELDPSLTITNVVASIDLKCKIDLKMVALHIRNAEYNPKKFAGVIIRINAPKSCAIIFRSGKMICTGSKSQADARLASRKFVRIIQLLGCKVKFSKFKIINIMATMDLGFPIRLQSFYVKTMRKESNAVVNYEPEMFAGVIYFMKNKITLLIFVSGKVTITGAKNQQTIQNSVQEIKDLLTPFEKGAGMDDFDEDDAY